MSSNEELKVHPETRSICRQWVESYKLSPLASFRLVSQTANSLCYLCLMLEIFHHTPHLPHHIYIGSEDCRLFIFKSSFLMEKFSFRFDLEGQSCLWKSSRYILSSLSPVNSSSLILPLNILVVLSGSFLLSIKSQRQQLLNTNEDGGSWKCHRP